MPASRQRNYLEKRGKAKLAELSKAADAVLTVNSISGYDVLYPLARRANIHIIPIDIATPIDGAQSGVAKLRLNLTEHPVWLNPYELGTMMTILRNELAELDDHNVRQITANLHSALARLRVLIDDMELTLANLDREPVVLVMDEALDYFVQGLQLEAYHLDDQQPSAKALAQFVAEKGINLVLTGKTLPEAVQAVLADKHIEVLKIKHLKADDPITQLAQYYQALAQILAQMEST